MWGTACQVVSKLGPTNQMSKNPYIREDAVKEIAEMIASWSSETISWKAVCERCEPMLGYRPTRQGLSNHSAISSAFTARSKGLRIVPQASSPMPSSLAVAASRIASLNVQVAALEAENAALKEKFVLWQYNAFTKANLRPDELNKELPPIDREVNVEPDASRKRRPKVIK